MGQGYRRSWASDRLSGLRGAVARLRAAGSREGEGAERPGWGGGAALQLVTSYAGRGWRGAGGGWTGLCWGCGVRLGGSGLGLLGGAGRFCHYARHWYCEASHMTERRLMYQRR